MRASLSVAFARRNLNRIEALIIVSAIVGASITLALGGFVRPETVQVVDASKSVSAPYGELDSGSSTGYDENFSGWTSSPNGQVSSAQNSLIVSGVFQNVSTWTSVILFKSASINLTAYPILDVRMNVTRGVRYGIRFFAQYQNGTEYNAWWEASALDHRAGVGYEAVRANVQRQAFLATGHLVDRLSKLEIYVENKPSTPQTFQLVLSKLSFINETLTWNQAASRYRAIYFDLTKLPQGNSSWYLNKINFGVTIQANTGSVFTIYLFDGAVIYVSTTASGIVYNPLTSFSEYTFYPNSQQQVFPELLPKSNASFVFVASLGTVEKVEINYVDFIFLPFKKAPSFPQQLLALYYAYFVFFLFLLPVGLAILVFREFFSRETAPRVSIATVLAVGLICRVALGATTAHVFDMNVLLTSVRGWFQFGTRLGSLGPTLPFAFFLYWMAYSPYAILQLAGFRDLEFLGHAAGPIEGVFIKLFPILMDTLTFFLLLRFRSGGRPFVWATFYFLNPLTIFVSSVWGQYEAATMAFIVWGVYLMSRQRLVQAALVLVTSGLIQLLGFLPYALLLISTARAKRYSRLLVLAFIPSIVLAYFPETDLVLRILLSLTGQIEGQYSQPGPYSIFGSLQLPLGSRFNPLLIAAGIVLAGVSVDTYRQKMNVERLVFYTAISSVVFLLFSNLLAAWLWLVPIGLLYAIITGKNDLGAFMLVFGTSMTFITLSNTTGSAYLLLGNVGYAIQPAVEGLRSQLTIFAIMTASLSVIFLFYLRYGSGLASRTLIRASGIALSLYLLLYFWLAIYPL